MLKSFVYDELTEKHETNRKLVSQLYSFEKSKNKKNTTLKFLILISFDLLIVFHNNKSTLFIFWKIKNFKFALVHTLVNIEPQIFLVGWAAVVSWIKQHELDFFFFNSSQSK